MARLINIGFGNLAHSDKVISIVSPEAAPIRRMIQSARELGKCVDATQGRKTKAVLVMEGDYLILSALVPDTIAKRFEQRE